MTLSPSAPPMPVVAAAPTLKLKANVKPREMVAGRYRVGQVSSDAVELIDQTTSTATTLALR